MKRYMIVNIMVLFSCLWVSSHCNILSSHIEEKVLKTFIFKRKISDWAKNSVSDDQQKKTK